MFGGAFSIALVLTGAFVLPPTALAQLPPLQGNILGTDGRPLQRAEVRLEGKDKPSAPITTMTGRNGRYLFAGLPAGVYRLSVLEGGAVKFSVNIKNAWRKGADRLRLEPVSDKKDKKLCLGGGAHGKQSRRALG